MSGKGTGLTTAYKCKKCKENVQQTVGSTSNLSDHLQRTASACSATAGECVPSSATVSIGRRWSGWCECRTAVPPAVLKSVPGRRTPSTWHSMQRRGNRNRNIIWRLVYISTWHIYAHMQDGGSAGAVYVYTNTSAHPHRHRPIDKARSGPDPDGRQIRSNLPGDE